MVLIPAFFQVGVVVYASLTVSCDSVSHLFSELSANDLQMKGQGMDHTNGTSLSLHFLTNSSW